MTQLATCYFCGTGPDAALIEHSVAESGPTVTLCPDCRQKLAAVLDAVPDHSGDAAAGEPIASDPDVGPADPSVRTGVTPDTGADVAGTLADAADDQASGAAADEDSDTESRSLFPDREERSDALSATDELTDPEAAGADRAADGEDDAEDTADPPTDSENGDGTADSDGSGDGDGTADSDGSGDGDGTADSDGSGDGADETENGDSAAPADASPERSETEARSGGDRTVSRQTYNRVIRLLENRELPVERAAIRTDAETAYDIRAEDFDAIVDAAVDRGAIGERDGQLVEPE